MKRFNLSIIIPTWNRKKKLIKLLKIILRNLKKNKINYEIIICDSFSSDETEISVKEIFKSKIVYKNIKHNSIAKKRNLGIKIAKYKNILLLDDDCVPMQNFFNIVKKCLDSPHKNTIFCGQYLTNKKLITNSNYYQFRDLKNLKTSKRLRVDYKNIITGCCFFNKKNIKNIYFNEKINGYGLEDIEWAYRLINKKNKIILTEAKVDHQETSQNINSYLKKWYMLSKDAMPSLIGNTKLEIKGKMFFFENLYKVFFLRLFFNLSFFIFTRPIAILLNKYLTITDKYKSLFSKYLFEICLVLYYFSGALDRGSKRKKSLEWYNLGYK
jgi:glycosyltransferase involved in cell wall biosynthesis